MSAKCGRINTRVKTSMSSVDVRQVQHIKASIIPFLTKAQESIIRYKYATLGNNGLNTLTRVLTLMRKSALLANPLEPSGNLSCRFKTMLFLREYNNKAGLNGLNSDNIRASWSINVYIYIHIYISFNILHLMASHTLVAITLRVIIFNQLN